MTFANPVPWWALAGIVAAAGLVAALAYRHVALSTRQRSALGVLRFVTLLTIVLLLMRPVAQSSPDAAADAIVPILVDTSRSMGIEDAGGARRIDRAREMLTSGVLPALAPRFQTEVLGFGESVTPMEPGDLDASARRSDLAGAIEAVRERYRGRAIAGIVLLSDGGETGSTAEPDAGGAPVFAIGVGSPGVARDIEVLSVTALDAVLDDSRIDLAVSAVSHGYGTTPIELRLLENGRPVDVRRVRPAAGGTPIREVFQVAPGRSAPTVYTVEVPAAPGEMVPENNVRSVLVQPPGRPRRVLLVQGAPGFEHSFLRRAWRGDSGLEIDSVVRQGRNEQGAGTFYIQAAAERSQALSSGYPSTREALFAYDAVVLANVEAASFSSAQLQHTRDFVGQRGGGLLVLGAQSFHPRGLIDTPLEVLLPLDVTDRRPAVLEASAQPARGPNRVALTAPGEAHPIMQIGPTADDTRRRWEAVPALASTAPLGGPRPGATVLAVTGGRGGAPRALVAVHRYGEGRSMAFTGEAAWRWRMGLPAADQSYEAFWRQAVRWLAHPATEPIDITLPQGAAAAEVLPVRIVARTSAFDPLRNAVVTARVTRPDGRVDSIPAAADTARGASGTFMARYTPEAPGVYRVSADVTGADGEVRSVTRAVLVGGADLEMTDPRLNTRLLQRLAAASGGRLVEPGDDFATLADDLRAALPAATLLVRRDLWHTAWSFAMVLALLGAEWVLRRRWGLR